MRSRSSPTARGLRLPPNVEYAPERDHDAQDEHDRENGNFEHVKASGGEQIARLLALTASEGGSWSEWGVADHALNQAHRLAFLQHQSARCLCRSWDHPDQDSAACWQSGSALNQGTNKASRLQPSLKLRWQVI